LSYFKAIDILIRIFCQPEFDHIVITPPTYGMYKVAAKINDVDVKTVSLSPTYEVIPENIYTTIRDPQSKILFLCSPGNPTSRLIPLSVIRELACNPILCRTLIVVDEAYIDFAAINGESVYDVSAVSLLEECPNIVVLQTLSKAFGLAGIRLGLAIASPEIIQIMNNVKAPYNINKLTVQVAKTVFTPEHLAMTASNIQLLIAERAFLTEQLKLCSFVIRIVPSDANFILFQVNCHAERLYKAMADAGIVCRYRGHEMHCYNCLRVTVGTHEENLAFLQLLHSKAAEICNTVETS
jgi:histidinol-phosphate aminotransferase